jgi:hypothetical protein
VSNGKGISDAVRGAIDEWITPELVTELSKAAGRTFFAHNLNNASQWVRRVRRGISNGWERDYECKAQPRIGLRVHTDASDEYIRYVTFRVDGKFVGGGVVSVPSVNISQVGRQAQILAVNAKPSKPKFKPFTAEQIRVLQNKMDFNHTTLDCMFEDRL